MTYRTISITNLNRLFEYIIESKDLFAPKEREDQPGFYRFDRILKPDEITLSYGTTTIPPKAFFFPPEETLFTFSLSDEGAKLNPELEEAPFVLAGVHPCDLAAIEALDLALGQPPADHRWLFNRRRAVIIGVDCTPDEYCFCGSVNTLNSRNPADLFLTPVSGGYLVEIPTARGLELLSSVETFEAGPEHLEEAETRRKEKTAQLTAAFNRTSADIAGVLESGGFGDIWKELASRCYSCGSCNLVCPTCFCFHTDDRFELNLTSGHRFRSWDSCQFLEFALVTGGHNFRGLRRNRVRHRWRCKFLHLYKEFGRVFCTGCGRCSRACTADINMADVINRLVHESENHSETRPGKEG